MSTPTRREFLGFGIGAAFAGSVLPQQTSRLLNADLIVLNANVYTVDQRQPKAEAFAVKDGRFIAVGTSRDIRNLNAAQTIDARGLTIVPGFIDAHSHPAWGGISELFSVSLDLGSIEEIKQTMRREAAKTAPGAWVTGFKYDDTKPRENRRLTREDLDEAVPDHPARVVHRGGHTMWYNSKAFAAAGITADTPDPAGGRFYKRDGKLDGMVAGKGNEIFQKFFPTKITRAQRQQGVKLIAKQMTAAGLTSVTDAECSADYFTAYQDARMAGELLFRAYVMPRGYEPVYQAFRNSGIYTGFGDEWLKLGAVKWLADGSAQERTMRMSTPFVDKPDDYGILYMNQDEINAAVEDAHAHHFQIGIHANGDVAIDMVLKAYERAQQKYPRPDPRFRIEHCSLINPSLLARIKAIGAIPTPFYTYIYYHGDKWVAYGEEKMRSMFAHKSFLDAGIPVAPASDYIPGPYEPLMAMQSMVTRKDFRGRVWGANQRISVEQALRICTINGAYASFEEGIKGSITVGKLADFTMLAQDPHRTEPEQIKDIKVLCTVVGGKTVHSAM